MSKPLHIHHHPGNSPSITVDSLVKWLKEYQLRTLGVELEAVVPS